MMRRMHTLVGAAISDWLGSQGCAAKICLSKKDMDLERQFTYEDGVVVNDFHAFLRRNRS
jgi:hypothetical protein